MSLRSDLLPTFQATRVLINDLGFRTNNLTISTKTWASGRPGVGSATYSSITITPPPKIREVSAREIASSGGRYQEGDLRVTKITPAFSGGGYTPAQIRPTTVTSGVEVLYVVAGPSAGDYRLVDSDFSKNFGYELTIRRQRTTP